VLALAIVALWSLAEGFLFFIVADVPISYVALRYGIKRAVVAALLAAPAAALGGLAMLSWASGDSDLAGAMLEAVPGIDAQLLVDVRYRWTDGGYGAMAAGAFGGIPYKLFAFAAGLEPHGSTLAFFAGSVAARLPRFLLVALIVGLIGRWLEPRLALRWRLSLLGLCWTAFYGWYFSVMPA
jgi:hypothetical protein